MFSQYLFDHDIKEPIQQSLEKMTDGIYAAKKEKEEEVRETRIRSVIKTNIAANSQLSILDRCGPGHCILIDDTVEASNRKVVKDVCLFFSRPADETALNQGYSPVAPTRYVFHKTKQWITPDDKALDDYIKAGEVVSYNEAQLAVLITQVLPAQQIRTIISPAYERINLLNLAATGEAKEMKAVATDPIKLFQVLLQPLVDAVPEPLIGMFQRTAKREYDIVQHVNAALLGLHNAALLGLHIDLQAAVSTVLNEINQLPQKNEFARKVQSALEKNFPVEFEVAQKEIQKKIDAGVAKEKQDKEKSGSAPPQPPR